MQRRMPAASYRWSSDQSLLVSFGEEISLENHVTVLAALDALHAASIQGLRDLHPAYASVLVTFDPLRTDLTRVEKEVRAAVASSRVPARHNARRIEVPVCYENEFAPDLAELARDRDLSVEEVVHLHSSADYRVYFLGFAPGFPYLGGLPERLATSRLAVPRIRVPAGSVAIGGSQTGVYPFATPGGWRIVGRTPLQMFDVNREPPALLSPGDRVRFLPIPASAFGAPRKS